jgi:hypothetical protein
LPILGGATLGIIVIELGTNKTKQEKIAEKISNKVAEIIVGAATASAIGRGFQMPPSLVASAIVNAVVVLSMEPNANKVGLEDSQAIALNGTLLAGLVGFSARECGANKAVTFLGAALAGLALVNRLGLANKLELPPQVIEKILKGIVAGSITGLTVHLIKESEIIGSTLTASIIAVSTVFSTSNIRM